nr:MULTISPECIES: hypothetical protein [Clostridium]
MIAHRLKTVRAANQIIVIHNGRIVQSGTHTQLIKKSGIYADFIGIRKKSNWMEVIKINLRFTYDGKNNIIQNVNLNIKDGEKIA